MPEQAQKQLHLPSLQASQSLGSRLASLLARGHLLTLAGDLGVGKTTLARAIIRARLPPQTRNEPIPSPTFSLLQHYQSDSLLISHADLYRIETPSALRELDLPGALEEGALLVEWPRFLGELQPLTHLHLALAFIDNSSNPEARNLLLTIRRSHSKDSQDSCTEILAAI